MICLRYQFTNVFESILVKLVPLLSGINELILPRFDHFGGKRVDETILLKAIMNFDMDVIKYHHVLFIINRHWFRY